MPTRGSVALWYNLDKKGHRDLRASHGGCPILKGSKWILNKWIYYFNQFNKFPCSTDPLEILSPPQGYYKNLAA
jgi:prolyl 4-hydroxylase